MNVALVPEVPLSAAPITRIFALARPWIVAVAALQAALAPAPAFAQDGEAARVRVDAVRQVALTQTAPVIGRLVATLHGVVAARVGGPVAAFLVEVGDRVQAGDPLAMLDDEMLAARRAQAAAALAEARARLETRRERLALARQELDRLARLKSSAAFSQARYEDQRQEAAIARSEVAAAEAEIESARADLQVAEIDLKRAEIQAPYAGVVTERMAEAGAYAAAGEPMLRMLGDRSLEVEAQVPQSRLAGLHPGDTVHVELDDGRRHEARVRAILPQENPQTRTRTVRAVPAFDPAERRLASGQSVTVHIPVGRGQQVLSVHKDAVIRREGQAVVFVHADGKAEVRPVQLGKEVGDRFEVVEGLSGGELAVVRGNERLRPGDAIVIDKRDAPGAGRDTESAQGGSAAG